jgi:hypothetical protein
MNIIKHKMALSAIISMAFFTSFYKIWFPAEVV